MPGKNLIQSLRSVVRGAGKKEDVFSQWNDVVTIERRLRGKQYCARGLGNSSQRTKY